MKTNTEIEIDNRYTMLASCYPTANVLILMALAHVPETTFPSRGPAMRYHMHLVRHGIMHRFAPVSCTVEGTSYRVSLCVPIKGAMAWLDKDGGDRLRRYDAAMARAMQWPKLPSWDLSIKKQ